MLKYAREILGIKLSDSEINRLRRCKEQLERNVKTEYVAAPFHNDGCTCLGGVNAYKVPVATVELPKVNPVLSRPLATLLPANLVPGQIFQPRIRFDFSSFPLSEDNMQRMKEGNAPHGNDGLPVQCHHVGQQPYFYIDVYSATDHRKISHPDDETRVDRREFGEWRSAMWKALAGAFSYK